MKQLKFLVPPILTLLLLLAPSCGQKRRPLADRPYKAVVVALTSVDTEGAAHFGLVERTFSALNDLDRLDGTYLQLLRGGDLSISEVNGSLVSEDSFNGGDNPDLRYTLDNGVVISSDYSTLAMLSSFYQFDYIYSKVEDTLGVAPSKFQEKLPSGKHTILFEPQIVFNLAQAEGSAGIKLNAAFSPKDKKFLMFQRSAIESVPLSSNLQVISHEFGHYVFDYSFLNGIYDEKNYLSDTFAMHGLNEGWADFISWNFTTSPDILRSSINIDEIANERHITRTTFKWDDVVFLSLSGGEYDPALPYARCRGAFYCIGTLFARSLLQAKADLPAIDLKTFTNALLVSLQSAQAEIRAMPVAITPEALERDGDAPNTTSLWERQGRFTGAFLRAIVKNAPASMQPTLCAKFKDNFNLGGFPAEARSGVCP